MVQAQTLPFIGHAGSTHALKEVFLHYVWQFQYFDATDLCTDDGEPITVFAPGAYNRNAGPDFMQARMRIGEMEWVGCVELHIYGSGWEEHKHAADPAYENVILHVVWENDQPAYRADGSRIPTLVLRDRIYSGLLLKYRRFMHSPEHVPCATSLKNVSRIVKLSMVERAFAGRLEAKANAVANLFQRNRQDWEETCYQLLARSFGFKINAEPFQRLALCMPYRLLRRHGNKQIQLEALLFGQAGFLEPKRDETVDQYTLELRQEYQFLDHKYELATGRLNRAEWKFLRLRPANFPSLRLAQFAGLLWNRQHLFSSILEAPTLEALRDLFRVQQSEYWRQHYSLGSCSQEDVSALGETSIDTLLINAVVPLLVAYGKHQDEPALVDRAIHILEQMAPEENAITRRLTALGWQPESALDSQGMLELYNHFCLKRRCLDCVVGASLLKPTPA